MLWLTAPSTKSGKSVTKSTRSTGPRYPQGPLVDSGPEAPPLSNVPSDLKYTATHEWIRIEGDVVTIGITDHAQSELGDIVYVDLPEVGRVLQQDETFGTVESVKTVSDLYAPVPGEVVDVNGTLGADSEVVNGDPYGKGWMVKIKVADPASLEALLPASAYEQSLDA